MDASSWTEAELLLECTTIDLNGSVTGTALFEVKSSFPSDGFGKFMDVIARGASVAGMAVEFSQAFPEVGNVGQGGGLLHLCRMHPTQCLANGGIRTVLHACQFRTRTRASIREPWAELGPAPPSSSSRDAPGAGGGGSDDDPGGGTADTAMLKEKMRELKRRHLERRLEDPTLKASERVVIQGVLADSHRKRERRGGKHHRRSRSSSSGRRSRSRSREDPLFPLASSRDDSNRFLATAVEKPGHFYDSTVEKMSRALGSRGGAINKQSQQQWVTYLNAILKAQAKTEDLPPERLQELYTLAEALDIAGGREAGGLPAMLDVMTQRFKSLEMKSLGEKETARALELVDSRDRGLTSPAERHAANRLQLKDMRLREGQEKLRR